MPPWQVQPAPRETEWKEMLKLAEVAWESAALVKQALSAALVPLAEHLAVRETGSHLVNEEGLSVPAGGVKLVTGLIPHCQE